MPAGFNKGQIEYIKTIANVNGHKTYKATHVGAQDHTVVTGHQPACDDHARYAIWCLGARPLSRPTGGVVASTDLVQDITIDSIDCYNVPIEENHTNAEPDERVTPECFLESVSCKLRQITNLDADHDHDVNSHKEFRLVIFRHKEKQSSIHGLGDNFSNPLYDMYWGAENRKYGPKGYRNKMDQEGTINYNNHTGYDVKFDRDAMLTDPINKEDYVVMKDCRYYLGREYGGKHIYEDMFTWDHEDPIATEDPRLDHVDNNKNYCWYIYLLGVNNDATNVIDNLGYIRMSLNTHVTSG